MGNFYKAEEIKIMISAAGEYYTHAVFCENGQIMIPSNEFFAFYGAEVVWQEKYKIMTAIWEGMRLSVRIGMDSMVSHGDLKKLEAPPILIDEVLYISILEVLQGFDATVEWFEKAKTIVIWKKKVEVKKPEAKKPKGKTIEEIWQIGENQEFVMEICSYLQRKCDYGKEINQLNENQKVICIVNLAETAVNSEGFDGFFFNSEGDFSNELVWAFEKIGAVKTARICKIATAVFGEKVPCDRFERQEIMENLSAKASEIWSECDRQFLEYEEDLIELSYNYIIENKDCFSD